MHTETHETSFEGHNHEMYLDLFEPMDLPSLMSISMAFSHDRGEKMRGQGVEHPN